MMKQLSLIGAALAMGASALVPVTPASAQRYYHHRDYRPTYRGYDRYYERDNYRRHYRDYRRCRDNGDGGTIIGAIAGGLLGHEIAGRGDHTVGTILGAGAGALAGRAIDRSDRPNYCR
ncbi:MAG: glycine zipper 2TM domain-containing protein [Sphingomonas sp.]